MDKKQCRSKYRKLRRLKKDELLLPRSELSGLYVMTGLGARGLTSAPLMAKQLTNQMFGLPAILPTHLQKAVSANRFQIKHLKRLKSQFEI